MTVVRVDDIWTDSSDGYTIRVVRYPYDVEPEGGGLLMGFSFHSGVLWSEIQGRDNPGERPEKVHIGPLVKTHTQFTAEHLERGFGPDTHYLLGRRRGGFPLRVGSRPAVEGLLAELKTQWQEYRRASNPEFRIKGLRAIRRARTARDSVKLADLKKRYPRAADYDRKVRLTEARHRAISALESVRAVPKKSSAAARVAVGKVTTVSKKAVDSAIPLVTASSRKVVDATMPLTNGLLATTQGLLASALSTDLNALVQNMVKGPATIYDKAMDAKFLETFIGGPAHRMFDGGHTVLGAIRAVRDASPDDTIIQEAMGFLEGMFKDMSTPKGLPLATWNSETYYELAEFMKSNFGISKDYFYKLNSYTTAELLSGVIGVVATALNWNRADTEEFSKLVGGMAVSAIMGANPLLLIVTVIALARAFHKAHHGREYAELADGSFKGGIGAGASLAAASRITAAGGPTGLVLFVGLSAGVLVNMATKKICLAQIAQFVAERATATANETKRLADHYLQNSEISTGNGNGRS